MPTIKIEYPEGMTQDTALMYVKSMVGIEKSKRVSEARGIPKFCHAVVFGDGTTVYTKDRRHENAADSFLVLETT